MANNKPVFRMSESGRCPKAKMFWGDLEFWKYWFLTMTAFFVAMSLVALLDFPSSIIPMIAWLCFMTYYTITLIIKKGKM